MSFSHFSLSISLDVRYKKIEGTILSNLDQKQPIFLLLYGVHNSHTFLCIGRLQTTGG
jgi:hypothetical protein